MLRRRMLRRCFALALVLVLALGCALPAAAEDASSVRLDKTEGTVTVTNAGGKQQQNRSGLRLYSGYHVKTAAKSYAWLNLDDSKAAKADENSDIEIRRSGRKLEVLAASGNVYFNVSKPLEEEETLNIRTATMVVGIRGTTGWVEAVDGWHSRVYLLEGVLEGTVTDPVSGQSKTTTLTAGQCADFYVYAPTTPGEKCAIVLSRFGRQDVPGYILKELVGNAELLQKIYDESGIDLRDLTEAEAEARQIRDEDENNSDGSNDEQEPEAGKKDPVWADGQGEDKTPEKEVVVVYETPDTEVSLTTDATVPEVIAALNNYSLVTLVKAGSGTFTVNQNLTVPAGKELKVEGDVTVEAGATLTVNGTVDVAGTLTNYGTVVVASSDTLIVGVRFLNYSVLQILGTGHLVLPVNGLESYGIVNNAGRIDGSGSVIILGGSFSMTGGEFSTTNATATLIVVDGSKTTLSGGSISNTGSGAAVQWEDTVNTLQTLKTALLSKSVNPVQDGNGAAYSLLNLGVVQIGDGTFGVGVLETPPEETSWRIIPLVLTEDGGSLQLSNTTAAEKDTVTVAAGANTGWQLKEGSLRVLALDGGTVTLSGGSFTMPAGDVLVVADFEQLTEPETPVESAWKVTTLVLTEGGTLTAGKTSAKTGDTVTVDLTPETGWEQVFLGYINVSTGEKVAVSGGSFAMPASDVVVTAELRKIPAVPTYNVVPIQPAQGTLTAGPASEIPAGTTVEVGYTPAEGWELVALNYFDTSTGTKTAITGGSFTMPAANVAVTAEIREKPDSTAPTYSLVPIQPVHGTLTASKATGIQAGETITLTIVPETGYTVGSVPVVRIGGETLNAAKESQENGVYTYTFSMPAGDAAVTAFLREEVVVSKTRSIRAEGVAYGGVTPELELDGIDDETEPENGKTTLDLHYGTMTISSVLPEEGDTVTFTLSPEDGYRVYGVVALDASGEALSVSCSENVWSFTVEDSDILLLAGFVKEFPINFVDNTAAQVQDEVITQLDVPESGVPGVTMYGYIGSAQPLTLKATYTAAVSYTAEVFGDPEERELQFDYQWAGFNGETGCFEYIFYFVMPESPVEITASPYERTWLALDTSVEYAEVTVALPETGELFDEILPAADPTGETKAGLQIDPGAVVEFTVSGFTQDWQPYLALHYYDAAGDWNRTELGYTYSQPAEGSDEIILSGTFIMPDEDAYFYVSDQMYVTSKTVYTGEAPEGGIVIFYPVNQNGQDLTSLDTYADSGEEVYFGIVPNAGYDLDTDSTRAYYLVDTETGKAVFDWAVTDGYLNAPEEYPNIAAHEIEDLSINGDNGYYSGYFTMPAAQVIVDPVFTVGYGTGVHPIKGSILGVNGVNRVALSPTGLVSATAGYGDTASEWQLKYPDTAAVGRAFCAELLTPNGIPLVESGNGGYFSADDPSSWLVTISVYNSAGQSVEFSVDHSNVGAETSYFHIWVDMPDDEVTIEVTVFHRVTVSVEIYSDYVQSGTAMWPSYAWLQCGESIWNLYCNDEYQSRKVTEEPANPGHYYGAEWENEYSLTVYAMTGEPLTMWFMFPADAGRVGGSSRQSLGCLDDCISGFTGFMSIESWCDGYMYNDFSWDEYVALAYEPWLSPEEAAEQYPDLPGKDSCYAEYGYGPEDEIYFMYSVFTTDDVTDIEYRIGVAD